MSGSGAYGDVEGDDVDGRISQHDIEAILSGGVPTDPSLDALDALIRSADFTETVPESILFGHVAAAASAAARGDHRVTAVIPRRRRLVLRGALSGLTAKILFGTAVALAATGGAAATGILPDPIQSVLADGASHIGIELPDPSRSTTTTTFTTTTTAATTTTAVTTTTTIDPGPSVLAGSYTWESTSCAGDPISVAYTVSAGGGLAIGTITGDPEDVDEDTDQIEVRYTDGIRIRISGHGDDEDAGIEEDERRDCRDDSDDANETDDADPSDDSDGTDGDDDGTDDDPSDEEDGSDTDDPSDDQTDEDPSDEGGEDPDNGGSEDDETID